MLLQLRLLLLQQSLLKSVADPNNYTASGTIKGLITSSSNYKFDLSVFPGLKTADITVGGTKDSSIAITVTSASRRFI